MDISKGPKEEAVETQTPEEIIPLKSLEEYEELTEGELVDREVNALNNMIVHAVNYSKKIKKSTDFLMQDVREYQEVGSYSADSNSLKHKEIKLARKLVEADEVCGTVLDRLISFCITEGDIEGVKDQKLVSILNVWKDSLGNLTNSDGGIFTLQPQGLSVVFEQILERLFVDGDAVISEVWGNEVSLETGTYKLPYKINVHDTLLLKIDETEFTSTGQEKISIAQESATSSVRKDLRSYLRKKPASSDIKLYDDEGKAPFTAHLKLRPKKFSMWGTSYFKRAFYPIADKKRLEALEQGTVEGMINRLTILLAGKIDTEHGGIIAPHRLAVLERLIAQPKTNNLLLWPGDDLDVKDIGPDSSILSYDTKFNTVNERILIALGFPRVLVDGAESSTENWQKFLGLISYFDKTRNSYLLPWLNRILRQIAVKNGFADEFPRYSFSRLKLYKLQDILSAVKVYYDRGLMSEMSAMTNGDLDYEVERQRRKYESEFGIIKTSGGAKELPYQKNTPPKTQGDKSDKEEGKGEEKVDKLEASLNKDLREEITNNFKAYLSEMHSFYSDAIVKALKENKTERAKDLLFTYDVHLKKDAKTQMLALFNTELFGKQTDKDLLEKASEWVLGFVGGFTADIEKEIDSIVSKHKENRSYLIPDLIAGVLASMGTQRLGSYSGSIYNKAVMAGQVTDKRRKGEDRMQWQSALTEKTCAFCSSMHGSTMSLDIFFNEFPPHAGCECWGVSSKEEFTEELPKKDPNNWGAILED
jgi:hypothetical protein